MKRNIILLVCMLFLLCGCTAEVNIDISSKSVNEEVIINAYPNDIYSKEQLKTSFRKYIPAFANDVIVDAAPDVKQPGIKYYNRVEKELSNGYKLSYSYNFKFKDYFNSTTVKNGFKSATIQRDTVEDTILISTDKGGLLYFNQYPYLNEIKVNIKSTHKMIDNNADRVNGNVYTWIFNKNNNKKNIYIVFDDNTFIDEKKPGNESDVNPQTEEKDYNSDLEKFMNEHPFLMVVLGLVIFLLFVVIISKIKKIK